VIKGLLETCHATTLAKVGAPADASQSVEERASCDTWAAELSFALLHRLWQMLLKGHDEVARAVDPREAADMAILRVIHASSMPDPGELARKLESGAVLTASPPTVVPESVSQGAPQSYEHLVTRLEQAGKHLLGDQLRREFGLVRFEPPLLALRPLKPQSDANYVTKLMLAIREVFGSDWRVEVSETHAAPSLAEQEEMKEAAARDAILSTPLVRAAFEAFPEAELISYSAGNERSATL
jgi:DNA polymerase III subunit gamma/tau